MKLDATPFYRDMEDGEERCISALIHRSFRKYIAHTYTPEGLNEFLKNTDPQTVISRKKKGQEIILALFGGEIVGVIAVRNENHISLLFVDEGYHGRGIAKRLVAMALKRAQDRNPQLSEFTVNSSPYAVRFYERLGFRPTDREHLKRGMRITPMRMVVRPFMQIP